MILTVCTGNICRSPAAALVLQAHLRELARVESAGVAAMVGHGIPAEMLMPLDADGLDGRAHEARQANAEMTAQFDLIVAMAAEHRRALVQDSPANLRRTFLLDELTKAARADAPLEGDSPQERLANVPAAIQGFRPELAGMDIADVPDPYRRSQARYDEAYAMITDGVRDIAAWVRG